MTRCSPQQHGADAPLDGQPPAPDQLRDPSPKRENPNASFHPDDKPQFDQRPGQYPSAKDIKAISSRPKAR